MSSVWVNYSFSTFNSEALIFFTVLVAQLSFFTLAKENSVLNFKMK
ncbi:hypothetical protein VCRA2119O147_400015 [Vibrio crassostreae]|uniref:Uncharacterized protein n=1 Tax=Vibrio crassostreae TaxID=246167 RepID=A0A822MZ03_9VIBR|nr:hypothetical protein VCRA2113O207_110023 [Vibrio crassostreae]CAK1713157.1 hypothetical protein VCRA2112O184_110024 [Vibrio crassostreae]CAK1724316.1 hypothetical protein VCRA2113O227_110131 [Vibrio crassostreae]CAK1724760.1 hypothetical protein VCRA2112O188_110134 [Vibrio crassostreae]CAK1725747.1 hypothetical protein VCRA2118O144_110131 [Vibrio crassostreae]